MDFILFYAIWRVFYRVKEFFYHWYFSAGHSYAHFVLNRLEDIDQALAWKITFANLFKPLYGDRSIISLIFGFIFRSVWLTFASLIYATIIIISFLLYIIWAIAPLYVIYKIV